MATETQKWTDKLKTRFGKNMQYSNMDNETALEIVDSIVCEVISDLTDDQEYSRVAVMIDRAYERFVNIKDARRP